MSAADNKLVIVTRGHNDNTDVEEEPRTDQKREEHQAQDQADTTAAKDDFTRDGINTDDSDIHAMKEDEEVQQTHVDERKKARKQQIARNLILIALYAAIFLGAGIAVRILLPT